MSVDARHTGGPSSTGRSAFLGDVRRVVVLLLASRAVLAIVGVGSRALLQPLRTEPYPWNYSKSVWLAIWGVWDSGWYLDIAQHGYSSALRQDPAILNQANFAFFPLYPLLMRLLAPLVGGPFVAGLVVSNVCLLVACLVLMRLVALDHGPDVARRAVKYLVLFPTAFILSGAFSESLFLALSVSAFLLVRKERLLAAGVIGFFASLTRSVGVVLVVPLLLQYVLQRRSASRRLEPRALLLLVAPLGLAFWSAWNFVLTGNALAFAQIQASWGRTLRSPLAMLAEGLGASRLDARLSAWMALAALAAVVAFARRLGPVYVLLSLLLIAIPLSTGLQSMPRYLLAAFPLPILAAALAREPSVDDALTTAFALLQGALMVFWANGFDLVV